MKFSGDEKLSHRSEEKKEMLPRSYDKGEVTEYKKLNEDRRFLEKLNSSQPHRQIVIMAKLLVAKFNELFEHKNNDYFVQAKNFLTTAYNRKRGKVEVSVVNFARKLDNNDESSMTKFYEYYKKPRMQDIELFAKGEIKSEPLSYQLYQ